MSTFAQGTAIRPAGSHEYQAEFQPNWCIGAVPHGGYITSCFLNVAKTHFDTTLAKQDQPHAITLHLEFVRRTETGPATFKVRDVKLGRATSIIHISLLQGGREEVIGYITHSNIAREDGPTYNTDWKLEPPPTPVDNARLLSDDDDRWKERKSMPFANFRKAAANLRWFFPKQGQQSKAFSDQWMVFRNGERFTNVSLGFVADSFPMIPEGFRSDIDPYSVTAESKGIDAEAEIKKSGAAAYWYPTLLLNLDIKKALPEEGVDLLFLRVRSKQIKNGRFDLEVVIMDEAGDVVALSHHVCMILPAARNLAKRKAPEQQGGKL